MRSLLPLFALLGACTHNKAPARPAVATCDTNDYPADYALTQPVSVVRDDRDIPHIYAQNDPDLFFASGYEMATDRLFEIDTFARAARGELAAVRGEDEVVNDLTARTFDFGRYACDSIAMIAEDRPEDYQLIVAFVSGVDRRVAEVNAGEAPLPWGFGPAELDYAPAPLDVADVVRMGQRINLGYSSTIEYDMLYSLMVRLAPNYADFPVFEPGPERFITTNEAPVGAARPPSPPPAHLEWSASDAHDFLGALQAFRQVTYPGEGSNNWAINPAYTDNGRPYIANDPHSSFHDPNTLYMQHLNSAEAGGAFDVVGFSFPGIPGVQLGHNDKLAWAATTNFSDQTDIWDVLIDNGKATIGGEQVPVSERDETITVKLADGTYEDRVFTIQEVDGYGVILPEDLLPLPESFFGGSQVLVNWVGFNPTDELFMYLDLDRADDLDGFAAAVDYQKVGMHNWMGATTDGIRYHTHGLIPDRGPVEGRPAANQLLDAADASTLWTGEYLPYDELPALDGSQPYFVSANNDPFGHTADNDPLNDTFYYGSYFSPSYRADRISSEIERMEAAGPVTAADMMGLQLDTYSTLAALTVPMLVEASGRIATDDDLAEFRGRDDLTTAIAALDAWDKRMIRGSAEPALFRAWQGFVSRRTLGSDLSFLFQPVEAVSPVTIAKLSALVHQQGIDSVLSGNGDYELLAAMDDALAWVAERSAATGLATYTWGDMHSVQVHPTWGDIVYLPTDGDESSPNVSPCTFWGESDPEENCSGDEGPIFRTVTGFADDGVPETWFNIPYGPDGDVDEWRDGVYDPLPYRRTDVDAHTSVTTTLAP